MAFVKRVQDRSVSDYKFALIPVIFLFLRMWSAIQSLILEISSSPPPNWLALPMLYLTVSATARDGAGVHGWARLVLCEHCMEIELCNRRV